MFDGDKGPNTGGMGAYSIDAILSPQVREQVLSEVIEPTIRGMAEEGAPFRGILYAGLMMTQEGPKVLEYNARFGDPETQVVLPRLERRSGLDPGSNSQGRFNPDRGSME